MKKIFILTIMVLAIPLSTRAVLRSKIDTPPPLQPAPEGIAPSVNANINTPGNNYNTAVESLNQQSNQSIPQAGSNQGVAGQVDVPSSNSKSASVYVVLIILASIGLALVLGFLYYRYRIKDV